MDPVFFRQFPAFSFFGIDFQTHEIFIVHFTYLWQRENRQGHVEAGTAPFGKEIDKDLFLFLFGQGYRFVPAAVEKADSAFLRMRRKQNRNE